MRDGGAAKSNASMDFGRRKDFFKNEEKSNQNLKPYCCNTMVQKSSAKFLGTSSLLPKSTLKSRYRKPNHGRIRSDRRWDTDCLCSSFTEFPQEKRPDDWQSSNLLVLIIANIATQ